MTTVVSPRVTMIGAGVSAQLPSVLDQLSVRRPLVVTDQALVEHGVIDGVLKELTGAGYEVSLFSEVHPDPTTDDVEALVQVLRRGGFDAMVAIGGGSPMDTAKAAGVLLSHPGQALRDLKAPHEVGESDLPLVCLPTTAGTGSEMTRFCIITDVSTHEKMLVIGRGCVPVAALVDVELSMSMPRRVTADTGLDALCHGVEAYLSLRHSEHSDIYAVSGVRRVLRNLRTVWEEPSNVEARTEMMLGATHAGMAFSASSVTIVHGMSRPIGAAFGVPHGTANAMLLNAALQWTEPHATDRLASLAREVGLAGQDDPDLQAARQLRQAIADLVSSLEVPTPSQFGIAEQDWLDHIPQMTQQAIASGSPANNPGAASPQDISALYHRIWA